MGSRSVTIRLGLPGLRKNETYEAPVHTAGASSRLARETFGLGATPFLFLSYGIAARPLLVVKFGKGNEYLNKGEV
jgi:hypothetical protein